jgi:beta-aspartyl-peptidase (threonine type)
MNSTMQEQGWALVVHGGAKDIPEREARTNREGVLEAARAGGEVLRSGGSALDAIEAAIRVLEDLPVFNAGRGSCLNSAGKVEMSAGIMDGRDLAVGGVADLRNVRNPIIVARRVLAVREVFLVGEGARAFAIETGSQTVPDSYLTDTPREAAEHDTVGAVALDKDGNLAAGTSTGGLPGMRPGRVGDSPIAGCGFYADNHTGGVSLSGDGESLIRVGAATRIMMRMDDDDPDRAILSVLERLPHVGGASGDGGAIAIRKDGTMGWHHNSPNFAVAIVTEAMAEPTAWLSKDEANV